MNNNDVYQKSDLSREEIKNKNLAILSREARTLLIMIDGKKTYGHYLAMLDNSKIFANNKGIAVLFELLQAMELIEWVDHRQNAAVISEPSLSQSSVSAIENIQQAQSSLPKVSQSSAIEKFKSKSAFKLNKAKSAMGNFFKSPPVGPNYEIIKSDLATFIEEKAPPQDAWGYLLSLKQCNNDAELLAFVEKIQKFTTSELSRGIDKFVDAIKNQS